MQSENKTAKAEFLFILSSNNRFWWWCAFC